MLNPASLTPTALADLAAGGTEPIAEDPVSCTVAVDLLLLSAHHYCAEYGGALHQESPVITVTCPWASDPSVTLWFRRLRHTLLVACDLDVAPGTAQLDGWTVVIRGEQS